MTYATQADLEARYPGELAQAGPKDGTGGVDAVAVAQALGAADAMIDRTLRTLGWTVPVAAPAPGWIVDLAVDLALYLATPTVLASQADFKDRRARFDTALATLADLAAGRLLPAPPPVTAGLTTLYSRSNDRLFGRGTL